MGLFRRHTGERGGLAAGATLVVLLAATGLTFARLYLLPTQSNEAPDTIRLVPAW